MSTQTQSTQPGPERPTSSGRQAIVPGGRGMDVLQRRLDQVLARVRVLRVGHGLARLVGLLVFAVIAAYVADRWLGLPVAVRAAVLVAAAVLLGRQAWLRIGRPLFRGPDRTDAARLVEAGLPELEGRVISALQIGGGADGSLEQRLLDEASAQCLQRDLRVVLTARPMRRELLKAAGALALLATLVLVGKPFTEVFLRRWTLHDAAWPRDTRLTLQLPEKGAGHVVAEDGSVIAARGGVVEAQALLSGKVPARVELVVRGERGERAVTMSGEAGDGWRGRIGIERGDTAVFVRGGDDDGADTERLLLVIEPPRLDEPQFTLVPPAYLGLPESTVGPSGLVVPEGTAVTVVGTVQGEVTGGTLQLASRLETLPLSLDTSVVPVRVTAGFTATESDSLSIVLTGEHGLATPDPSHHALLVQSDRPPTLRLFAPARSDVKVTTRAVVPFAVIAEDDHKVESVRVDFGEGKVEDLQPDATRPSHYRRLLDLTVTPRLGVLGYRITAADGRDLPGHGPQVATAEGRRVDIVEDSEVQRLLADRQLRLKESFKTIRERQQGARESVLVLADAPPAADDSELVAAVVAQNQVTTRLSREVRELCGVLEDTLLNRLDPGPGAAAVLNRRVADWQAAPLDDSFAPASWRALSTEYTAGAFGRLDLVGRLLDMAGLALTIEQDASPAAHKLLSDARSAPDKVALLAAAESQAAVLAGLDQLLARMDEWEDYQEVLLLVKSLIDDQRSLRARTQAALSGTRGPN